MITHKGFHHPQLFGREQMDLVSCILASGEGLISPTWPVRLVGRPASKLPCLLNGIPTTAALGRALTRGPWFVNI